MSIRIDESSQGDLRSPSAVDDAGHTANSTQKNNLTEINSMRFMLVRSAFASIAILFIFSVIGSTTETIAQTKKDKKPVATANKQTTPKSKPSANDQAKAKPSDKKNDRTAKTDRSANAKKDDRKAKDTKRDAARSNDKKTTASKKEQDKKQPARTVQPKDKSATKAPARTNERDKKSRSTASVENRREAAEKRAAANRAAEERRQAVAEQRRQREQAAREARERQMAAIRSLKSDTRANIANDNVDGEDMAVRNAAIRALGDRAGSVVVMEAKTGKVLTIVNQDWAVRTSIRPCSTIKIVTGVAGVSENVIDRQTGTIRTSPNGMTLDDALAVSNNPYFQRVGSQIGNTKLIDYARRLGLGEPTGVNIEGETAGKLPYNNNSSLIYSHGDDFEVSTIQLAVMAATVANGGNRVLPRVPRGQAERAQFQPFYRGKADLPQPSLRRVIPGMMGSAEYGTARRGLDQNAGVAAKTGTCSGKGTPTGLYTSVAPIEDPKYVVAVITRGPGERGRTAAAVGAQIYSFLMPNIVRTNRNLAQTEFNLPPRNRADLNNLAKIDGEDPEAPAARTPNNVIVVPSAPRPAQNDPGRLVTRTGSSRPTFPPVVITYDRAKGADKPDQQPQQ